MQELVQKRIPAKQRTQNQTELNFVLTSLLPTEFGGFLAECRRHVVYGMPL